MLLRNATIWSENSLLFWHVEAPHLCWVGNNLEVQQLLAIPHFPLFPEEVWRHSVPEVRSTLLMQMSMLLGHTGTKDIQRNFGLRAEMCEKMVGRLQGESAASCLPFYWTVCLRCMLPLWYEESQLEDTSLISTFNLAVMTQGAFRASFSHPGAVYDVSSVLQNFLTNTRKHQRPKCFKGQKQVLRRKDFFLRSLFERKSDRFSGESC